MDTFQMNPKAICVEMAFHQPNRLCDQQLKKKSVIKTTDDGDLTTFIPPIKTTDDEGESGRQYGKTQPPHWNKK